LPTNRSISNVLSSLTFGVDYDQVSYWDEDANEWKHYVADSDFNDFDTFEYGKSYEINVIKTGGASFTISGVSSGVDVTHNILSGENFISPAVQSSETISTLLTTWGLSIGTEISDIRKFDASTQTFKSYTNSDFTTFEVGEGYIFDGLTTDSFTYGKTTKTSTFVYDSTGARVKKTVGSSSTIYLGKDYDVTSSLSTKYIFLGDRRISTKDSTGKLEFIHDDHISSSNIITDASGNQTGMLEYTPYGSTASHTGTADPKHKFTGQEEDGGSGLYYYGARYYDPTLGRFITADPTIQHPADPQDFNRYAYARNNPIVYNDPTGLGFWSTVLAIVGAVIGAVVGCYVGGPAGCATGAYYGAIIGGAIGGAAGGVIDAKQNGGSILSQAIFGAINGAIIGASVGKVLVQVLLQMERAQVGHQ
jgi:RHS repeat-associated protein